MRLFYSNLIDLGVGTITGSSAVATLPAANVAHEFRAKVWRTGTSTAAESIVFDLASAQTVTAFIALDHTLTASDTLIKIQGHTSDSWGSPAFTQVLGYAAGPIAAVFLARTYRYWRFTFTKSSAGVSRDIGRIFLGTHYETAEQPDYAGYGETVEDNTQLVKSVGGQTYADAQASYRVIKVDFSDTPQAQSAALAALIAYVGRSKSFFVQIDTSAPLDEILYVKLSHAFARKVSAWDAEFHWDIKGLEFEEQL